MATRVTDALRTRALRQAARLREFLVRLQVEPERTRLRWWLAATQLVTVLLVAVGLSWYASGSLHEVADGQGRARVQLGGTLAREDVERLQEDTLSAARTLADRATLQAALAAPNPQSLAPLLERFCDAEGIDACAVFDGPKLLAQAGPALPWNELAMAAAAQGQRFLADPQGGATPLMGGSASVSTLPAARVYVVRLFNARLAASLSRQVGLEVRLLGYRAFTAAPLDALTSLHTTALADGRFAVRRIDAQGVYAASFPVFASTGEPVALIEARLASEGIDSATATTIHRLLLTALLLAGLAVAAGVFLGQFVADPVQALTEAAERLGQGDFSTSIPPGGAAEVGVLARTMEDMRRNLVQLTGALRRRESEARAMLAGIVEGVYAVDKGRVIRYLNPQAARLLGVDAAQAVGRFCGDVLKPQLRDGRLPCEEDCPILKARGQGTARALERLGPGGLPRTAVITSSDISDGLQVQVIRDETELEAARRARDSVLANISHEFRTPLAAQLASIELLRDGLTTMEPHSRAELVLSLERGTLRLTRLIDNLLESVRIESGQLGIRRQSVDLALVVEEARALVESLLVLRQQRLQVDLPPDLPPVSGDETRLTQVFVNLLANANKFAPEASTLRIGAQAQGGTVTAWVEDEGPGVAAGDSGSIFERFRRGAEVEPEPGGLGLGLWIVKSIVERHGGTIAVERTRAERTRFSITLPQESE
ncbi:MAG TPA: ATP-binding protein [Steroidobacteraceae bacterium]|nr:ATP-binding protein [Steroidobacteraceae bacterium]